MTEDEPIVQGRHRLGRAALILAAAAAALALWAGLSAAGADTPAVPGGRPSIILTQTDGNGGGTGHRCHNQGGTGDEPTQPTSANSSSV